MYRQVNPSENRISKAPYNFVPLPEKYFFVEDKYSGELPWESQNKFLEKSFSGEIHFDLTALTPLFIRGQRQKMNDVWDSRENRFRKEPFTDIEGNPLIPGSSIRGMIRNIFEIITFSKVSPIFPDKLFYRSMAADSIGQTYRNYMMKGGRKPQGGFFKRDGLGGYIEPCEVVKVPHNLIDDLSYRNDPNYKPDWKLQGSTRTVTIKERRVTGKLVLTGSAPKKKHEFIFVRTNEDNNKVKISEDILERFEDDDQVTQWQERAFPKNKPHDNCRRKSGALADGEPVFYLCDDNFKTEKNPDGLIFFGRAQMFRLPYDVSPEELAQNSEKMDLAEAVFGKVDRSVNQAKAVKGRVFFLDAHIADGNDTNVVENRAIVPKILSSPRPTTFQHYLVQTYPDSDKQLRTYLKNNPTNLRGHKLYWHRWSEAGRLQNVEEPHSQNLLRDLQSNEPRDKMHTIIKPVKQNTTFYGKIKFYNLKKLELGALLCALDLPDECAHKLGMAKPHGLGSIKINVKTLNIFKQSERYLNWQSSGIEKEDYKNFIASFEALIKKFAVQTNEPIWKDKSGLESIFRIDALYKLLNWNNQPDMAETRYQELEEFKDRKVLPTPHFVMKECKQPFESKKIKLAEVRDLTKSEENNQTQTIPPPPPPRQTPVSLNPNQESEGVFIKSDGNWVARFEADDREGRILNCKCLPDDLEEGARAIFMVRTTRKSDGLTVEFRNLV